MGIARKIYGKDRIERERRREMMRKDNPNICLCDGCAEPGIDVSELGLAPNMLIINNRTIEL